MQISSSLATEDGGISLYHSNLSLIRGKVDGQIISINKPSEGRLRSRKVVSRSRARPTGKFPSSKMKRMIQWESPHELNAYRLLDADPEVLSFYEQPLVINYILDGVQHRHYPDILVETQTSKELWEVKTRDEALKPKNILRTKLMCNELPNHGYQYRVALAEDLARNPRLTNALLLLRLGRNNVSFIDKERISNFFSIIEHITWKLITSGKLGVNGKNHICRLIMDGYLFFDIDKELTKATIYKNNK
ncbi:MAG: TnsA endonuclease N-terminal domain-containing protein [Proteobacteria bacterium]|nr:hypothetical protein [Desulfobulbaceae bacterium]MBU4152402.1 TnsA endonuclease N-terminal domain-containing protein [Pseudomonadota bacterium]